jgi:hypothetical protein
MENRKSLSTQIFKSWNEYITQRVHELPEELKMTTKVQQNLHSIYQVYRDRKQAKLETAYLNEFLNQYVKIHGFEIPIDPTLLLKQIHPFYGNMTHLDKFILFEDLVKIFDVLLVASFEVIQGQTLLASEICSFAYWNYQDTQGNGYLSFPEFVKLMKIFRFELTRMQDFQEEFAFMLSQHRDSLVWSSPEKLNEDNIMTFDVFRHIYLERNL